MRWMLLAAVLVATLQGCRPPETKPSSLQALDGLGTQLRIVSGESSAVARYMNVLSREVGQGNAAGAQRAAASLRRAASRLSLSAAKARRGVLSIELPISYVVARRYSLLLARSLQAMVAEAVALVAVADLAWEDPMMLSPRSSRRLKTEQMEAAREAGVAVAMARSASQLKLRHVRVFRYVWTGAHHRTEMRAPLG